jgi:hypothetical protein
MDLTTQQPIAQDERWLSRCEIITRRDAMAYGDLPGIRDDVTAWQTLRAKQASAPAVQAHIGGRFQIEQCLDYRRMP